MDCAICCETITAAADMVGCPKCYVAACSLCICKFIVSQAPGQEARCMSCQTPWPLEFLLRSVRPSLLWAGAVREHRQQGLWEREKALLPATAIAMQVANDINALVSARQSMDPAPYSVATKQLTQLRMQYRDLTQPRSGEAKGMPTKGPKPQQVVCPCPVGDCRGFVFAKDYTCGSCARALCQKCRMVKEKTGVQHICKEDDIASVQLINTECKACPGCGVPSRKTEGCDQVWCLNCHKAWDWRRHQLVTGYIHATDYINYLRNNKQPVPRNPLDNPCGMVAMDPLRVIMVLKPMYPTIMTSPVEDRLIRQWRFVQEQRHIQEYRPLPMVLPNLDLRLKYLKDEIDEAKFKAMLHKRDKAVLLQTEVDKLYGAYMEVMGEAITNLRFCEDATGLKNMLVDISRIQQMMQAEFETLANSFNSKRWCQFYIKGV